MAHGIGTLVLSVRIHAVPQLFGSQLPVTCPRPLGKGRKRGRSKEVHSPLNLAPEVLTPSVTYVHDDSALPGFSLQANNIK